MANLLDTKKDFGPKMRALNPMQQRFVIAMLELGSTNYTRAALLAGYADNGNGAINVQASRLAHNDRVIDALNEEAHRRLMTAAPMAVSELLKIAETDTNQKYKLKAIEMVLNRTGHHALTEHKVEVAHTYSDKESIARIISLAKQMNMDPVKLLGNAGVKLGPQGEILDAEFTEVEQEQISAEGAEHSMDEFDWKGDEEDAVDA